MTQQDDLEQLFFGSSWSRAARLKRHDKLMDKVASTWQLGNSNNARWMGRRHRRRTEEEKDRNMHAIQHTKRSNAIQLASNSIISSDRLTLLAEPNTKTEQQQQNMNTNQLLAPTNHRQRETILSNYIPTSTPQTTTSTNAINISSSISDEQSNSVRLANKPLHVPLINVDETSNADLWRLYGSTSLLFVLIGFILWRCLWTRLRKSATCLTSGDEWPSVSLLTPKKRKKKNSETITQAELSLATKAAHDDQQQMELAERRPDEQADVIQVEQPGKETQTEQPIKLVALKRRLAKSSLVVAASRVAKPKVRLIGAQVRKFIDDEARELRERGQVRPDEAPSTLAGHLLSWLRSIKFTGASQQGEDLENNANNLQQVRVLVDQYEHNDKEDDQQAGQEGPQESPERSDELPVEVIVHNNNQNISPPSSQPSDVHQQPPEQQQCQLPADSQLCSPFSLVSSTSQIDSNRVATCGCSLLTANNDNNPIGRSKSQSGAQSAELHLSLNGGQQVPASNQPYRPCCSVSPSSMMANPASSQQLCQHHPRQFCHQQQHQNANCFVANKLGDQTNRIKRHYENYYDDEHEDAYRRLTASIGMQFGLSFDNHGQPAGPNNHLQCHHHHHQHQQQHWQPTSSCKCCPPVMMANSQPDSSCRDPSCHLCRPSAMNPANMAILVQQPSTATPPPPVPLQQAEPERQLDFWLSNTTTADDQNTDRSTGRSSGNGSDQEPSLASSCLTTANSADHLLANNNNNNPTTCSSANLLPNQFSSNRASYHSSTSPLSSVSPTNRNNGSLNWSPRRRFSCRTVGSQQQQHQLQHSNTNPMQTAMMMSSPRRMSIAGDQVRNNNNKMAHLMSCQLSNQSNPLQHRASIASDGAQHSPLAGRPRNFMMNANQLAQQHQQQHSCASSDHLQNQLQRPSDASLYDVDSARFYCSSSIHRPDDSNVQSNYGSSVGSSSGIGFSGSQCTNTPTTTNTTSGFPFASFASNYGDKFEQQYEQMAIDQYHLMQQRHLYNFAANQLAGSEAVQFKEQASMPSQMFPDDQLAYRQHPQARPFQPQPGAPPPPPPAEQQHQQPPQSLAFCASRKFSLPVQLESQAAERMSSDSPLHCTGGLLFQRNQLDRVDSFSVTSAAKQTHNFRQFKLQNYPLPGEPLRCSQDKQQVRRSSQTITRQSSFWLEDNSLDSVISMTTTQQPSLDESGPILPDDSQATAAQPELVSGVDQTPLVEPPILHIEQTGQSSQIPAASMSQQVAPSPTSSSSTNSPRDKRLNPFKFGPNNQTGARHHHGRTRLSSSSSTTSSTPSPDFSRPSERILQLVSKSSSISKRRLFGGRLRARRHGRPQLDREATTSRGSNAAKKAENDDEKEQRKEPAKTDQTSDTNDLLMSLEREDEFSSVDGDFKSK